MRVAKIGILLVMALLLVGCEPVLSLHPLWSDKSDVVFEPALIGTWIAHSEDDQDLTLSFQAGENQDYTVDYSLTNGEKLEHFIFRGYLIRVGTNRFLDLSRDANADQSLSGLAVIPAHWFLRTRVKKDSLQIGFIDDEWLSRKMEGGQANIAHETVWDGGPSGGGGYFLLLTANSNQLQSLCLKYADEFQPFPAEGEWHREKQEVRYENADPHSEDLLNPPPELDFQGTAVPAPKSRVLLRTKLAQIPELAITNEPNAASQYREERK